MGLANLIPRTPGIWNYIVLGFSGLTGSPNPRESGMVVFKDGFSVMFNMLDHEVDDYLEIIKRHASGCYLKRPRKKEDSLQKYIMKFPFSDCEVREKLKLPAYVQGGFNHIMLQNLNIDGISIIASVLGRSVALGYYSRLVDRRISGYVNVFTGLEEGGTLCSSKKLIKLAQRTNVDAESVYCFGLSERADVAWKEDSEHSHMLDYLKDEFKSTQRFADLDHKLKMGKLNIWFTMMQMAIPDATAHVTAYIIGFTLILCLPVAALPIRALDTYLMSI